MAAPCGRRVCQSKPATVSIATAVLHWVAPARECGFHGTMTARVDRIGLLDAPARHPCVCRSTKTTSTCMNRSSESNGAACAPRPSRTSCAARTKRTRTTRRQSARATDRVLPSSTHCSSSLVAAMTMQHRCDWGCGVFWRVWRVEPGCAERWPAVGRAFSTSGIDGAFGGSRCGKGFTRTTVTHADTDTRPLRDARARPTNAQEQTIGPSGTFRDETAITGAHRRFAHPRPAGLGLSHLGVSPRAPPPRGGHDTIPGTRSSETQPGKRRAPSSASSTCRIAEQSEAIPGKPHVPLALNS